MTNSNYCKHIFFSFRPIRVMENTVVYPIKMATVRLQSVLTRIWDHCGSRVNLCPRNRQACRDLPTAVLHVLENHTDRFIAELGKEFAKNILFLAACANTRAPVLLVFHGIEMWIVARQSVILCDSALAFLLLITRFSLLHCFPTILSSIVRAVQETPEISSTLINSGL